MDAYLAVQCVLAVVLVLVIAPHLSPARAGLAAGLLGVILYMAHVSRPQVSEEVVAEAAVRAIEKIIQGRRPSAAPAIHWHSL